VAGALTGGLLAAAAVAATRDFRLRQRTVAALPEAAAPPLRILHLSDLHLRPGHRALPRWLAGLAAVRPDLVVITGDVIGHPDAVGPARAALAPFLRTPGIVVGGSHDYFPPDWHNPIRYLTEGPSRRVHEGPEMPWRDLRSALIDAGWHWPINDWVDTAVAGRRVVAYGTDDAHIDREDLSGLTRPPAGAQDPGVLRLGVTHAPYVRVLTGLAEAGCHLTLAGHTHGGQVCWPSGAAIVANCDVPLPMARGLTDYPAPGGQRMWLHVSAGLGTSPYTPFRLFCPPEATLLTLV